MISRALVQSIFSALILLALSAEGNQVPAANSGTGAHDKGQSNTPQPDADVPVKPPPSGAIVVSRVVQEQKLITAPKPNYPPLAKSAKVQGICRFDVLISKVGAVEDLVLERGQPLLVNAAKSAILQYRYEPTEVDGVAKKVWTIVDVKFSLP